MGIFDRLKPQPRWKHADPAVRLRAVAELDDAAELATLAEQDPDAAVRTAALAKVGDLAVLGRIAAGDADEGVRDAAADRLLAAALDATHPGAVTAAGLLTDLKRLSTVAKSNASDEVRSAALALLKDERALGSVARRAAVESTALAALARLVTNEEILGTALNSEHKDVALAAFDRFVAADPSVEQDVAQLKSIEARAQQKAVGRRARALLQGIEDAENARRAAEEAREREQGLVCAAIEALASQQDPDRIAAELERHRARFAELACTDAMTIRRFDTATQAATVRIARRREEIAAAQEEARRREEALGLREQLCRRAEAIDGTNLVEQADALQAEWAALPAIPGFEREVGQISARFSAATAACRARAAQQAALDEARTALETLVTEAESLATADLEAADARWPSLQHRAQELAATLDGGARPAGDLVERLTAATDALEARRKAARDAAAKALAKREAKFARLVERAGKAAESETLLLRDGEQLLADLVAGRQSAADGQMTAEIEKSLAALKPLQARVEARVKELRDLDTWRRFANGQQQEALIAMAEAIVASLKAEEEAGTATDLAATAKALRELHAEWKKVADGPQPGSKVSWERFRTATEFIHSRCEVHFVQVREERARHHAAKVELAAKAEALADSTDWAKTAAALQEMQKAWEDTGPPRGAEERELAQRFRAACHAFFSRRREDLNSKKQEWSENLARKVALCERAEQFAESTEWDTAASELKKLQAEWKTVGPVRRDKGEALWTRFRSAADKFFERYANRHKIAEAAMLAESEALVAALEALGALEEAPDDLATQVQTLRTTISNAPQVEGPAGKALYQRWLAALAAVVSRFPEAFRGTELDPAANRERRMKLLAKVESFVGEEAPNRGEAASKTTAELLAERLRSALESNALGARPDETKWRKAGKAVEDAQEAWQRLMRLPDPETDALEARFRSACRRVMDQVKQHVRPSPPAERDFGARGPKGRPPREGRPERRR